MDLIKDIEKRMFGVNGLDLASLTFLTPTMNNGNDILGIARQLALEIETREKLLDSNEGSDIKTLASELVLFKELYKKLDSRYKISEISTRDLAEANLNNKIKRMFELAYYTYLERGGVNNNILSSMSSLGIHPQVALTTIKNFVISQNELINENKIPAVTEIDNFLQKNVEFWLPETKKRLASIYGTDTVLPDITEFVREVECKLNNIKEITNVSTDRRE